MKYLGIVKREDPNLKMPDAFRTVAVQGEYEAIEVGGDVLLVAAPLDRDRLKRIEELARQSIQDHRGSLEGLAR